MVVGNPITLREWLESASLPALATMTLVYAGSTFQLGYFAIVGVDFLSMAGVADWIFYVSIEGTILLTISAIVVSLLYLHRGTRAQKSELIKYFGGALIVLLFVGISVKVRSPEPFIVLPFVFAFYYFLSETARSWIWEKRIGWVELAMPVAAFGLLNFAVGVEYARFGGRQCVIVNAAGDKEDVRYLRSLGDGHLFRRDGRTVFRARSAVVEMDCKGWVRS
ncbi:hypothetical protein [Hyphomicrobium sp. CS1BSMeth3]|uniref:hypothetical protein n=1 Tax=Hyphomicrobium sp. CS1BSMeth3 TaxID=1892844 RepID=UPI001160B4E4|nr:hypothetical protein [Hyphomicrobium sp. CS1BSMeth3]